MRVAEHNDPQTEGDYYVIDYVAYTGWLWWRREHVSRAFVKRFGLGIDCWRCANTGQFVPIGVDRRLDCITKRVMVVSKEEAQRAVALDNFHARPTPSTQVSNED